MKGGERAKDKKVTRNGRKLLEALEEVLIIWNKNVKGDRKNIRTWEKEDVR